MLKWRSPFRSELNRGPGDASYAVRFIDREERRKACTPGAFRVITYNYHGVVRLARQTARGTEVNRKITPAGKMRGNHPSALIR
jgi:hypothetical protein